MSLTRSIRQLPRFVESTPIRSFSVAARRMAEGDTGAPRAGGAASGDAFTRREHAQEEYAIRQRETEKLKLLREKIAHSESQLAQDKKEAAELAKKHE